MELREYQSRTVAAVNASHESGQHLSTCVVLPTGGGKTVVAQELCEQRGTSLFVVHTTELLEQTAARFRGAGHRVNVIAPGYYPVSNASIHVGTVQSIVAREASPHVQFIVLDECFPPGTLVDGRRIDSYRVGDKVHCFNHEHGTIESKRVTHVFRSKPSGLLRILHSAGEIICTPEHPIWLEDSYVSAKEIVVGDLLSLRKDRGSNELSRAENLQQRMQEQISFLALSRVEGIEILEPGCDGTFGGLCPDGFVFNLEVETHSNYFANGVLVHNCHHYVLDNYWSSFLERYPRTPRAGFTATPQRSDGRPLGDMFTDLIVGAQYSELIDQGFIVPAKVFQPARGYNVSKRFALALDPIEALARYGRGQAFGFAPSVKLAREYAARSDRYASIDGKVPKSERRRIIDAFRAGSLDVLWNYNVLTEGVDIPSAETVILGRAFSHVSAYMQAVGRVLRSAEGKEYAIVIDLGGVTHIHGFPTDDRVYSLDGDGIRKTDVQLLRNCPKCGCTLPAVQMLCDECGYEFKTRDPRIPQCFSLELQEAMAGTRTVESAKEAEYNELRAIQKRGRKSLRWLAKEYKKRFQCKPAFSDVTRDEKHREHALMRAEAMRRGYRLGWVSHQFHALFGHYPGQI